MRASRHLPPGFGWHPPAYALGSDDTRILTMGGPYGQEIALVRCRVDGAGWAATINRHLDWRRRAYAVHATRATAMRMLTRWATVNATRILQELEQRGRTDPIWGRDPAPTAAAPGCRPSS